MRALVALAAVAVLGGCGENSAARDPVTTSPTEETASSQAFDALTIRLEFPTTEVQPSGELATRMVVENRSGAQIVDPGCQLVSRAYALVPLDDPDAELWIRSAADCGGPFTMPDGFTEESDGPTFYAHTGTGEPLPPGDYLAVLQIEGRSTPLRYPVTVR